MIFYIKFELNWYVIVYHNNNWEKIIDFKANRIFSFLKFKFRDRVIKYLLYNLRIQRKFLWTIDLGFGMPRICWAYSIAKRWLLKVIFHIRRKAIYKLNGIAIDSYNNYWWIIVVAYGNWIRSAQFIRCCR